MSDIYYVTNENGIDHRDGDYVSLRSDGQGLPSGDYKIHIAKVVSDGKGGHSYEIEGIGTVPFGREPVRGKRALPILAVNTLKNGTDEEVAAFLQTASYSSNRRRGFEDSIAVFVTEVFEDKIEGLIVFDVDRPGNVAVDMVEIDEPSPVCSDVVGIRLKVPEKPFRQGQDIPSLPNVQKGDILCAGYYRVECIGTSFEVHLYDALKVGKADDQNEAFDALGFARRPAQHFFPSSVFAPIYSVDREFDLAFARTQPDRALVLIYQDPGMKRHAAWVLGSSGYHAAVNDDLSSYFEDQQEPGLWLVDGVKNMSSTSYEGEHDAWVEGDFIPATRADIEELFGDISMLDDEIRDILELEESEVSTGLAAQYMEMARQVDFEGRFRRAREEHCRNTLSLPLPGTQIRWDKRAGIATSPTFVAFLDQLVAGFHNDEVRDVVRPLVSNHILDMGHMFTGSALAPVFEPTESGTRLLEMGIQSLASREPEILEMARGGKIKPHVKLSSLASALFTAVPMDRYPKLQHIVRDDSRAFPILEQSAENVIVGIPFNGNVGTVIRVDEHGFSLSDMSGLPYAGWQSGLSDRVELLSELVSDLDTRLLVNGNLDPVEDGVHDVGGRRYYVKSGLLHREDGPAVDGGEGDQIHYFRGVPHAPEDVLSTLPRSTPLAAFQAARRTPPHVKLGSGI